MDLATAVQAPGAGGAVACPVCTLYLREGISLQRHLDTHPKEQVIEALIRASASGQGHPTPVQSPLMQAQQPTVTSQGPATAPAPAPAQAQYPMGLFECPPIMQPQFASFSYQQFVNNGTMMIPQYAMAPQNNHMMQMFYNPYGMYQHQQVPTVQMISPITPMPATTTMTTMSTMTTRFRATSSTIEVPRSIAPPAVENIVRDSPDHESESVLPDLESPDSPPRPMQTVAVEDSEQRQEEIINQPQTGNITSNDCEQITRNSETVLIVTSGQAEGESILPEIIEEATSGVDSPHDRQYFYANEFTSSKDKEGNDQVEQQLESEENLMTTNTVVSETADLINGSELKDITEKDDDIREPVSDEETMEHVSENTVEEIIPDVQIVQQVEEEQSENITEVEIQKELSPSNSLYKESQDEEQLEQLLTNIIESELQHHEDTTDESSNNKDNETSESVRNDLEEMSITTNNVSNGYVNNSYFQMYNYRKSQSVPSSPVMLKKFHRTNSPVSLCSDLDSVDNLCIYPVDLDSNALQDCTTEENFEELKDDMDASDEFRDPYDGAETMENDLEIERSVVQQQESELPCNNETSSLQSTTATESSIPYSPSSVRSYCNVEVENSTLVTEDFTQVHIVAENVPIDCTKPEKDKHNEYQKTNENGCSGSTLIEQKIVANEDEVSIENSFSAGSYQENMESESVAVSTSYPINELENSHNLMNLAERVEPLTNSDSTKSFQITKSQVQKPSAELLNISEDAHVGPVNVFEFDGLQILVPSTFISDSSQKAVSGTSQQSMASSEGGTGIDEEIKSVNMRADESMPSRGELSEQESNGCTEQSAWQLYMGQESSRVSTSYDLMARESWEESEGSDNESGVPLLDSRSLATHFASSLFLDRDRKTPTRRAFKCSYCIEVFECPKERRVHITTTHKEASSSGRSGSSSEQHELKDIKLLDGRTNVFEDIFSPGIHVPQTYHQQPLLHQLQPPQRYNNTAKSDTDPKIDGMSTATEVTCTICNQRFASEKSLQMHRRRMHETAGVKRVREVSKCQICQEEFPSVVLFNTHLKIHPLECGQCGKYFYRKQNFKLHMKRHLGIKPFACTTCDKAFLTKQKLDEHMNGHTGNAPVKCNLCNETFRRYSNLTQHKNRHHLNIKKKLKDYICHCGEVFHTKKKLAWHKETHDEKPKACTYCNERFVHMASLTRHMRRAHNRRFVPDAQREVENVECPICKCIYLRSSLAVHMRVHNGERPYECQVCSKTFSTKWNLQLHKWTHAARSAKPFKCNQCSAAFYRHSDHIAHMNSHRNVRPYTCNYCGAQFIRKYNCIRHVKEHEENKAHTCEICKKTFHRSYYLKEHLRVHSGARPYSCHICGKSSSTKSNHNKHVRIHHAREPVNTEN